MQPHNADPNKVLSYQTAEDSAHIDCSPSYSFQFGAPQGTMMTQLDLRFMVPALAQGIYVISADYEGRKEASWRLAQVY
ncbi:sphingosine N-acyltransferase subunit lip1 [Lodderomyces elongisporus]|uniref:sphingosine N-acyltransferase subunit lip1 n=1 Tax=Lodderomyces elongisporus TaxID=36914 RepID=UPI00291D58E3|nr:sphingosine N-acyltransferase subunit lip1 [Lodderomyces elongisporus]WLF81847.1 sphingosine N-acyltransferase subunit lip1 [Lodderomyces elongisporus]